MSNPSRLIIQIQLQSESQKIPVVIILTFFVRKSVAVRPQLMPLSSAERARRKKARDAADDDLLKKTVTEAIKQKLIARDAMEDMMKDHKATYVADNNGMRCAILDHFGGDQDALKMYISSSADFADDISYDILSVALDLLYLPILKTRFDMNQVRQISVLTALCGKVEGRHLAFMVLTWLLNRWKLVQENNWNHVIISGTIAAMYSPDELFLMQNGKWLPPPQYNAIPTVSKDAIKWLIQCRPIGLLISAYFNLRNMEQLLRISGVTKLKKGDLAMMELRGALELKASTLIKVYNGISPCKIPRPFVTDLYRLQKKLRDMEQ